MAHGGVDEQDPKQAMLEKIRIVGDEPEEDNLQFEFDGYARWLVSVIKTLPTPFTVGIHGEWGSGKTTLIRRIRKTIREGGQNDRLCLVEFDAWKYERADVVAALLTKISSEFTTDARRFTRAVLEFVADAALRHYGASGAERPTETFQKFLGEIDTIHDSLEKLIQDKLGDGRMIVVIDDLDRCHADNVLDMMEAIKMFLSVKNLVFVIAADMAKIESAWALRYRGAGADEGRAHADKMFQLVLPLPPKSEAALCSYVKKMAKLFGEDSLAHFIKSVPPNPRKIKRSINLLYCLFHRLDVPHGSYREYVEFCKHFDTLVTLVSLRLHHPYIARPVYSEPAWLPTLAALCRDHDRFDLLKKERVEAPPVRGTNRSVALPPDIFDTLDEMIKLDDRQAFEALKTFAERMELPSMENKDPHTYWKTYPNAHIYKLIKRVIDETRLMPTSCDA